MDPNPTPFPVKNQTVKSKPNRKLTEPSLTRQNRAFGTIRNTNIVPTRIEKLPIKASTVVPRIQPQWNSTTGVPVHDPAKTKKKKKTNSFKQPGPGSNPKPISVEEKTPIAVVQTRMAASATPYQSEAGKGSGVSPYQSAKICSKCRFDKLETASYWLGQIKLSESVGKHFVSAGFFRLAFHSKAEPMKKLCIELKRYLGRNGNIGEEREWREVCASYGILKDENLSTETQSFGSVIGKLDTHAPKVVGFNFDQQIQDTTHVFSEVKGKSIEI